MFVPHQNLSDQINGNIIRSEIEGGVYLRDLPDTEHARSGHAESLATRWWCAATGRR